MQVRARLPIILWVVRKPEGCRCCAHHLGIAHLFTERIGDLLDRAADSKVPEDEGLFQAALRFRVLRHNGYDVAPGTKHLKSPKSAFTAQQLAQINHALELPRHMRIERFEAWRVIQESTSPLLELASLDYNVVQSQLQEELTEVIGVEYANVPERNKNTEEVNRKCTKLNTQMSHFFVEHLALYLGGQSEVKRG
ncbi:unnamed protein product [Spirodela intermedia]|uniref:Uncharacterized protein n=1 Tax=Spirodela intermedia TaxID=51605 RepID=A0A7I8ICE2_SPIIN|nr:unnamed protein product [Spirodela intermedia]CAA6655420.1 unnamed protein product [Spirodela intermedia]